MRVRPGTAMRAMLWGLLLSACGAASDGRGGPTAPLGSAPAPAGPGPSAPAPAPYEVHEWGLLRSAAGDTLDAGAVSPPVRIEPTAVDKPILYFHARGPVALKSVRVEAVGGAIREHWPLTGAAPLSTSVEWRDLALDPAKLAGGAACAAPRFPALGERPCSDLARGELCESPQLGSLVAADANCLSREGPAAGLPASPSEAKSAAPPFLFYRSRSTTFTPPLRLQRLPSGELRVTNDGDRPIPGRLIRLRSGDGWVQSLAVRPPAPHASITIGSDFTARADDESDDRRAADHPAPPGGPEPGRRALRATLQELGLTPAEGDAFIRAWDPALFGGGTVSDGTRPIDVLSDKSQPPTESLVYFLPPEACEGVARLTFDPPPLAVKRALAIWARF